MTTLTIIPSNKSVEVQEGTRLLDAILAAGEDLGHKCDGKAECGTCHIFLQAGKKGISKTTPAEHAKLDTIVGVGSKSRLACQMTILGTEDITVELLGFNSGL